MHQGDGREIVVLARTAIEMDWAYCKDHVREIFTQWAADRFGFL